MIVHFYFLYLMHIVSIFSGGRHKTFFFPSNQQPTEQNRNLVHNVHNIHNIHDIL